MRLAADLAALIAVMSTGVVYGTDVFCALVQRPALARVDDATLTSVMGNVHRFGDRRLPVPGILGMITSAAAVVLAALAGRPVASATAGAALALLVLWLLLYLRVQRADQPRAHRRRRQPRDTGQRPRTATRLGPHHRAPRSSARPGCRRAVREPPRLNGLTMPRWQSTHSPRRTTRRRRADSRPIGSLVLAKGTLPSTVDLRSVRVKSWPGLALTALVVTGCGDGGDEGSATTTDSATTIGSMVTTTNETSVSGAPVHGAPAVWLTGAGLLAAGITGGGGGVITSSSTSFTANVIRLECSSGITGEVLAPEIVLSEPEIVISFSVAPLAQGEGEYSCPGNPPVPYVVELGEPIGARQLIDAACLPGGAAETTTSCADGAARWSP